MLNIYWKFLCCESRIPVGEVDPTPTGLRCCSEEDFDRFGRWAKIRTWRQFDGCPECDAPGPQIYGREFVLE